MRPAPTWAPREEVLPRPQRLTNDTHHARYALAESKRAGTRVVSARLRACGVQARAVPDLGCQHSLTRHVPRPARATEVLGVRTNPELRPTKIIRYYALHAQAWKTVLRLCSVARVAGDDGKVMWSARLPRTLLDEVDSRTREGASRTERIGKLLVKGLDCSRGMCRAANDLHTLREEVGREGMPVVAQRYSEAKPDLWAGTDARPVGSQINGEVDAAFEGEQGQRLEW